MKKLLAIFLTLSTTLMSSAYARENFVKCEDRLALQMEEQSSKLFYGLVKGGAWGATVGGTVAILAMEDVPSAKVRVVLGGVFAAVTVIYVGGAAYDEYRFHADKTENLLQLFKDIQMGGMGPEIEHRISYIRYQLTQKEGNPFGKPLPKFAAATYDKQNIQDEIMAKVDQLLSINGQEKCADASKLSQEIDSEVLRNLIVKYNPEYTQVEVQVVQSK